MKISQAIASAPAALFPKVDGERRPDYKGLFVHAVTSILDARKVKYDQATVEKIAEHLNLSTYQRQAASECARRYGAMGDEGKRMAPVAKPPKPKKTGIKAIDGVKRKKDPITGEAVKKAAKKKAQEAIDKAKKDKPTKKPAKAVEKAPKKDKPAKTAEKPAKDKSAKGKKPAIDPISGEPIAE